MITKPTKTNMTDHDVPIESQYLKGKKIAVLGCGGIAAMKLPSIVRGLRKNGAEVQVFLSKEALKYVTVDALEWSSCNKVITGLTPSAEHLKLDSPFDSYFVVPATYNTINKIAQGIADNLITTILAANLSNISKGKSVVVLPTMHGNFHNVILEENIKRLEKIGVKFLKPRDEYGKHNLPSIKTLIANYIHAVSVGSLKGTKVLITAGNTPVAIDPIRRITNIFQGSLGIALAKDLYLRGAEVKLILGGSSKEVPEYINCTKINSFKEYENEIYNELKTSYQAAVFSAAVADYFPKNVSNKKIKSKASDLRIDLVPTHKIIDQVKEDFPSLKIIGFKYETDSSEEELSNLAIRLLANKQYGVVVNEGNSVLSSHDHKATIYSHGGNKFNLVGKRAIAEGISDVLSLSQ